MNGDGGSLALSFGREQEAFFLRRVRTGSVWALLFYPLFILLDWAVYPQYFATFLVLRVAVEVLLVAALAATFTRIGKSNAQLIAAVEYVAICFSILGMIHIAEGYESPYYAGIILSLLFLQYISPLEFRSTLAITVLVLLFYLAPTFLLRRVTNWPIFINNTTFLTGVIFFLNVSSFYFNQMRFQEFKARHSLAQANEELKKLDVLKSQFFANVSHEVRTPLTSILAPIQTLYHGDLGALSGEQSGLVSQMYRNALKLLDMINQMLDFSKYEAGKMQLRLKPTDLGELASDTVAIFKEVADRKGVKLHFIQEDDTSPAFLDGDKIERILTNLVRNAIKFTDRGSITVRVGRQAEKLYLEVRDTGIGIPATHLPEIFKRFQQVDGSSTRKYEGTGLGLTIVKESVELMHGTVTVDSEQGRGTSFRVEIPAHLDRLAPDAFVERRVLERRQSDAGLPPGEERRQNPRRTADMARVTVDDLALVERELVMQGADQEDESAATPAHSPAEGADSVLLVEDNADLRRYIGRMLARFGYRVTTAVDGLDGWEHTQNDRPELVISDVMMPRMDGFELIRRIKTNAKTKHIPVILITAKSELESKLAGLEMGADDYLPKPVNLRELDARIRNLLTMRKFQLALAREDELKTRMEELTMSFSLSLDMRDSNTARHSRDVLELGTIIAEELGLEIDATLRDSLLLHDIGKQGIPDGILLKQSSLSDEEWALMKKHPEMGAGLLGHFPSYKAVSEVVLAHQEHYDGTGYPRQLKGESIPMVARIIATADAYHAMTNDRPYRKALPPAEAVAELIKHSGTQFDPHTVQGFLRGLQKRGWISPAEASVLHSLRT